MLKCHARLRTHIIEKGSVERGSSSSSLLRLFFFSSSSHHHLTIIRSSSPLLISCRTTGRRALWGMCSRVPGPLRERLRDAHSPLPVCRSRSTTRRYCPLAWKVTGLARRSWRRAQWMRALLSGPEVAPSLRETGRASGAAVGRKGYPKAGRLTSLWPNFGHAALRRGARVAEACAPARTPARRRRCTKGG